ncbi:fibronectin type III domain-containing protein [Candidatus Curtissbacteria bacterium]|nr:fibronectin type III domain-containing protein [Candidatus Curtissbacteria bacterium]
MPVITGLLLVIFASVNVFASISSYSASDFSQFCSQNSTTCKKNENPGDRSGSVSCPSVNQTILNVYVHAGGGQTVYQLPDSHFSETFSNNNNTVTVNALAGTADLSWIAVVCSSNSPTPTPTATPTPTPTSTPNPCDARDHISFWNLFNIDVEATAIVCPTPTPTPTPSPTPSNPPIGGGPTSNNNGGGNITTPSCSPNSKPQDIDQVWVTDVTSTSLIVHWANKGDATGFQIAYGPADNKYQWGVKVGNVNQTQINGIPANLKVVVTVIPVNGDCAGNPTQAGPSVLAATGFASNWPLYLTGMSLMGFGLFLAGKKARV